jgi:hypothetical protein
LDPIVLQFGCACNCTSITLRLMFFLIVPFIMRKSCSLQLSYSVVI